uniref:DUF630 domain-containing protein n=1 Tax=Ananas comosus var. bracteatus TaxID=296719 RepID=A0A6V7NPJ6_ANACO|nr:unnamed protein product [Ananas comosus var. bracteatus]
MGCVLSSRIEEEDTVRRCKERRRLAKQLLSCRAELAAVQLAYLRSLRNTGATLRQFAEQNNNVQFLWWAARSALAILIMILSSALCSVAFLLALSSRNTS